MNVQIRDREPFERLNPVDVASYLRAEGWKQVENQPDRLIVWSSQIDGEKIELLLPLRRTLGDYVLRMSEAVTTLAAKEGRSQLEILSDLQTASADVVRIKLRLVASMNGSILLDQGAALVENAREMMFAGACADVQRKPYYSRPGPEEANRFMRGLRMGQTEWGSYVLTVHSPVSPSLTSLSADQFVDLDPPFERRAINQLAVALAALREATDQALCRPNADLFQKSISAGVSANLCSAIVGMSGADARPHSEVRISFTYARSRPADASIPREIVIPDDHVGIANEAARIFRASAPPEETEICGAVVQLKGEEQSGTAAGPVTVMAFVDGRPRRVQINLDREGHRLALLACEQGAEIACTGDLVKHGNSWELKNPKGFSIVAGD